MESFSQSITRANDSTARPAIQAPAESTAILPDFSSMIDAKLKQMNMEFLFPYQRLVVHNLLEAYALAQNSAHYNSEPEEKMRTRHIVLLPTGAGKSLCFQLPALIFSGITMVVYPLLALIHDQKRRLESAGIPCEILIGGQTATERAECFDKMRQRSIAIVLTNPEMVTNQSIIKQLKEVRCVHLVIDEAHCISVWGNSFRKSYLELGKLYQTNMFSLVTAFTATASESILQDIKRILFNNDDAHIISGSPDRSNIRYEVRRVLNHRLSLVAGFGEQSTPLFDGAQLFSREQWFALPAIVFCRTRAQCEQYAQLLASVIATHRVKYFHAGLTAVERHNIAQWFMDSTDGILCATCAYGMGMDKPNIRSVIHIYLPSSIENYVQEAGRSGRDGLASTAVILLDPLNLQYGLSHGSANKLGVQYSIATERCRREMLLEVLGESQVKCSGCDYCDGTIQSITNSERLLLRFLYRRQRGYTLEELSESIGNRFFGGSYLPSRRLMDELEEQQLVQNIKRGAWKNRFTINSSAIQLISQYFQQ